MQLAATVALAIAAIGGSTAFAEPEAYCAPSGGWQLLPATFHPTGTMVDDNGNGDGYVCTKVLKTPDGAAPGPPPLGLVADNIVPVSLP